MTANLTAQFFGDPSCWHTVTLQLWSVQSLWGGYIVSVAGPGAAVVRRILPGAQHEQRYEVPLHGEESAELLRLLIAHDALAIEPCERTVMVPDEAETILTLRKGRRTFALRTLANDPADARVSTIVAALSTLTRRTEGLAPIYDGPYQHSRDELC
jgi:hypothetical protein